VILLRIVDSDDVVVHELIASPEKRLAMTMLA